MIHRFPVKNKCDYSEKSELRVSWNLHIATEPQIGNDCPSLIQSHIRLLNLSYRSNRWKFDNSSTFPGKQICVFDRLWPVSATLDHFRKFGFLWKLVEKFPSSSSFGSEFTSKLGNPRNLIFKIHRGRAGHSAFNIGDYARREIPA